ncbi:MAG: hybrid sensor histidine kinase/response regulator [Desulfovibrio sp.]|nr:MAG: hybrid sensor histidine kinase/response regulator [Desulfovibrio sp.]
MAKDNHEKSLPLAPDARNPGGKAVSPDRGNDKSPFAQPDTHDLKEQIRYLAEEKRAALDALELAGTFGNISTSLNQLDSPLPILSETDRKIRALINFESTAFFLVDDNNADFHIAACFPEKSTTWFVREADALINDLTFAWALDRIRPHFLGSTNPNRELMLHPLSTMSRTRGMFLGTPAQPKESILDVHLSLSTLVFLAAAHALESYLLYQRIRETNTELSRNLRRLELSEKELMRHRKQLEETVAERTIELTTANEHLRREVAERTRAEEALALQLDYEQALSSVSQTLFSGEDTETVLNEALSLLYDITLADRIQVFENIMQEDSGLCMLSLATAPPDMERQSLSPYDPAFIRWAETLVQGQAVHGLVDDFPSVERVLLSAQGAVQVLALPVSTDADWLGFLLFEDFHGDRVWLTDQVRLLQTCAEMLGAFLKQRRMVTGLREAKRNADQANTAKTQFLANISHELRTPLHGIIGMGQLLADTALNSDQRHFLGAVQDSSRQLLTVISDLLDLSQLEAKTLTPAFVPFFLRKTMEPVLETYAVKARNKGLSFSFSIDHKTPDKLMGDPFRLLQMTANLVSNAVKFTDAGQVDITVASGANPAHSNELELEVQVRDTGVGIALEKMDSIFDSFSLGEDFMTKRLGGTGMGLAITRQLADTMKGSLEVDSTPGKGSEFLLRVRLLTAPELNAPVISEQEATTRRILLADDDTINHIYVTRCLAHRDIEVVCVEDGFQALELLARERFDLVLMDVQMPGLNGLDTVARIRDGSARVHNPKVPVVAVTAFAADIDRRTCLAAGMDDFLAKPLDRATLVATVNRFIRPGAP